MFYFQRILLSHSCQKHASVPFQLAALKLKYFIEWHDVLCFRRVLLSLMSKVCICPIPNLEWSISTCSWSNTLQKLLFKWCAGIKNLFPPTADRCIIHHWAWKHGRYIFFFFLLFFFTHHRGFTSTFVLTCIMYIRLCMPLGGKSQPKTCASHKIFA